MTRNRIRLSEGVHGGNQQYARESQLSNDREKIPQYYDELMNKGVTFVSWADDDFYDLLQQKGIKFDVKPCADYYERTKFTLINESKNKNNIRNRIRLSEGQLRRVIKESVYRILNEADDSDFDFSPSRRGSDADGWDF